MCISFTFFLAKVWEFFLFVDIGVTARDEACICVFPAQFRWTFCSKEHYSESLSGRDDSTTELPPGIFMRWFWRLSAFCPNEAEGNADYFPIFVTVCCFCKDQLLNWTRGKSFDLFSDVLRNDKMNADAVFIRGLCLYYDDNIEKAVTFFTHALKLSPDHSEARSTLKVCVPEAVHLVEFSWSCAEKFALMLLIVRLFSLVWVHLFWNAALSKTSNWLEIFKNCVDVPRRVEVMVVWLWKP